MAAFEDYRGIPKLLFVHSTIDDTRMTANAFRVYCHLARRAGRDGQAFPSYQSIGDICFEDDSPSPNWRRKLAITAVKELIEKGMLIKKSRSRPGKGKTSNLYGLTPQSDWTAEVRPDALG